MGHNGCLSLRKLGKSVKVQNLPYPFLRGQPLKHGKQIHFVNKLDISCAKQHFIIKMQLFTMFITAVCVLFLIKLRCPKTKNLAIICSF